MAEVSMQGVEDVGDRQYGKEIRIVEREPLGHIPYLEGTSVIGSTAASLRNLASNPPLPNPPPNSHRSIDRSPRRVYKATNKVSNSLRLTVCPSSGLPVILPAPCTSHRV